MFKKYKCVLQKDLKDCGPACILTILKQYNVDYSVAKLREIVGTDKQGTNLYGMIKGLNYFNFKAKGVRIENRKIDSSLTVPMIAHIKRNNYYHYVVIQEISKNKIIISDPAKGVVKLSYEEFYKEWTGILILVEKNLNIKNIENSNIYIKFFKIIFSQKTLLLNIILISVISTIIGIVISFYFKILIDYILVDKLKSTLNVIMIGVIFLSLFKIVFEYIREKLILFLSVKIDDIILFGYYNHIINLPLKFFSTRKIGEIVSRFSDGVNVRQVISETVFTSTVDIIMLVISGILLFNINKVLLFISILVIFSYFLLILFFKKNIKEKNQELLEDNSLLISNIIENIKGIETIKSFNLELRTETETYIKFFKMLKSNYRKGNLYNIINLLTSIISNFGNFLIVWIGTLNVINENMTLGEMLVFLGLLVYFIEPLKKILNLQSKIQIAIVTLDRINEIMDLEIEESNQNKIRLNDLNCDIEINDLKFRYGTRKLILDGINLKIKSKEKVAFVGQSGSGKTTLIKLLLKYYDYESGNIKLGKFELKDLDTKFLREKISYVSQETFLFNKSIIENLILNENIDYEKVIELCEKLDLLNFINELPNKFETIIEEDGSNLSGGQKQRLSIIRALLKNPEILILDEATSNLDLSTEKLFQKIIDNLNITIIIIAHRLSTIKKCDKIFVFKDGKIVEFGNHEELLNLNRNYTKYWEELIR